MGGRDAVVWLTEGVDSVSQRRQEHDYNQMTWLLERSRRRRAARLICLGRLQGDKDGYRVQMQMGCRRADVDM